MMVLTGGLISMAYEEELDTVEDDSDADDAEDEKDMDDDADSDLE